MLKESVDLSIHMYTYIQYLNIYGFLLARTRRTSILVERGCFIWHTFSLYILAVRGYSEDELQNHSRIVGHHVAVPFLHWRIQTRRYNLVRADYVSESMCCGFRKSKELKGSHFSHYKPRISCPVRYVIGQ